MREPITGVTQWDRVMEEGFSLLPLRTAVSSVFSFLFQNSAER